MKDADFPSPFDAGQSPPAGDTSPPGFGNQLRDADAGGKVVRGAAVRTAGYVIGIVTNIAASVVLLRYLGVAQFGSYVAVMSVVSIAGGISDGGLTAVGNRELALVDTPKQRREMASKLLGMRLVITPVAVVISVAFALVAGFPTELIAGTMLAGVGWSAIAAASALAMPLSVDLRIVPLASLELIKQVGITVVIVLLVLLRSDLLLFFGAAIPGALVAIALTPLLVGKDALGGPTFRFREWSDLIRSSVPIALAAVVGVVYLRFLTVLMFQFTDDTETGLFGTSARIIEAIGGIPLLAFMVGLPVLSASKDSPDRLRAILQRMVEVGMLLSGLLVTVLFLGARPIVLLVGGAEYLGAVPILQIQSFALVGALLAMACMMAAIAMDMRGTIIAANTFALATVVALGVPSVIIWGGEGAAAATVVGDLAMGLTYWWLLGRVGQVRPRLVSGWKALIATLVGLAAGQLVDLGGIASTAVGVIGFAVVILVTRAIPDEVFDAVRRRRPASAS